MLRELYVSYNGLTSFDERVVPCARLAVLDLAANQLRSISVGAFPVLEDLWINNNVLEEVHIRSAEMPLLTTVYLEGNPFAARPDYREVMLNMVPTLTQLDALNIQ